MVDSAGGRSQLAQLTTSVVVLLVLLFLTGPLAYLPLGVLATVVFLIGVELIKPPSEQDGVASLLESGGRRGRGRRHWHLHPGHARST